jgi:hypothetical protein
MSTTFAYHEDGTVGSLAIQPRAISSQASAIGPERRRSAGGGAHSMRRANAESTVHQKAIRTRHFLLKSRPNGHKRQAGNELRATSRATKAGRRDIEARSCQLSALSSQPSAEKGESRSLRGYPESVLEKGTGTARE